MKTLPEIPAFYSDFMYSDNRSEQAKQWFIKFIVQSYPQYFKKAHREFWVALCEGAQYSQFHLKDLITMDDIPNNIRQATILVLFGCRYGLSPLRFLYYLARECQFNTSDEYLAGEFVWFGDGKDEFDVAMENFFIRLTLPQQKLAYEISLLAAQFMAKLGNGQDYVSAVLTPLNGLGKAVTQTPRLRTFFFRDIPICLYGLPELLKLITTVQNNVPGQTLALRRIKECIRLIPEEKRFQNSETSLLCENLCRCLNTENLRYIAQKDLLEDCLLNTAYFSDEFYTSVLFTAKAVNLCNVLFKQDFKETAERLIDIFIEKNCSIEQFDSYDRENLSQSLRGLSSSLSKPEHIKWKNKIQSDILKKTKLDELMHEKQLQELRESIDQRREQEKIASLDKFKQALENVRLNDK